MASEAPKRRDLTSGPIGRTLLLFAIPTLASNVLQSLNGSINSVWVGRFLGESALAATANANVIMFLMFSAVFGFGMAATVMVGQAMGRGDIAAARESFGAAIGFCVGLSIIVAGAGWAFAPDILHGLSTPENAFPLALDYLRIIFLALPGMLIVVMLMMGLRGAGDAMTPLWFMILSVILDAGLNPVLILGLGPAPEMGIRGAATATLIANYVSMFALLAYIYWRDLPLRLRGRELGWLWPRFAELRLLVVKGLPMGVQMIVLSGAGLMMVGLVNQQGLITTAAYGAAQQVWTYIQMPAMAIGSAVSAMAAQNIGAGRWERINAIARSGILMHCIVTGVVIALILLFDRPVLALFLGAGSPAIDIARHMQFLASWSFLLFGISMVFFGIMRANGVVLAPLFVLAFAMFPVRLGFYHFAYPFLGADALWLAFPVGSLVATTSAFALYAQGSWRKAKLLVPPHEEECREAVNSESDPAGRMAPTG
ncbi:MATE family efflux transporter [Sphingobium sp. H39-3-25]|uniref:MATE family efflux transporter n=1 Tax=Sphingobium arseniciresistens TaxID=3030834 RepID=UPI0023B9559C|nr:MATE family efflux transporter [Sphingobium arseniciresistens]